MNKRHKICTLIPLSLPTLLLIYVMQVAAQTKTTISGWLRTGVSYTHNDTFSESFYRAKVQFDNKLSDDLESQIDIRGESDTHEIELREALLTVDLGKAVALDFGQSKKRFGLEFQKSKEKLLTVERTLLYQYLEPLGLAGRDLNIRYHRKARPRERRTGISMSLGYDEAHNTSIIGHVTRLNTLGSFALGGSGTVIIDKIQEGYQTVWGLGLELLRDTEAHHVEFEVVVGQDPMASEIEKKLGGKNVYFGGGKILYGHRMNTSRKLVKAIEPVVVTSLLARNLDDFGRNTIQFLAGLNIYVAKQARLSFNGDLQLTSTPTNKNERSSVGSNAIVQMELQW